METLALGDNGPFQYIVFWASGPDDEPYRPTVDLEEAVSQLSDSSISSPLGFDARLIPVLPALWYCLHLPRSVRDFRYLTETTVKLLQRRVYPHQIQTIPLPWDESLPRLLSGNKAPTLVFAPTDLIELATERSSDVTNLVGIVDIASVGQDRLAGDWNALYKASNLDDPLWTVPEKLEIESSMGATLLANHTLAKHVEGGMEDIRTSFSGIDDALQYVLETQAWISASEELWDHRDDHKLLASKIPEALARHKHTMRFPVALAAPGISSQSVMSRIKQSVDQANDEQASDETDNRILEFLVTHRALASNGVALVSSGIDPEAFGLLAQLESLLQTPTRKTGRSSWRILSKLGKLVAKAFSESEWEVLLRAGSITCFSEFPIGLAIPPTGTAPLAARVPITYRPIVPLTRAFQVETAPFGTRSITAPLRVLVAECIPEDDLVGRLSRIGWEQVVLNHAGDNRIELQIVETPNISSLNSVLELSKSDVLVLSAHGSVTDNRTVLNIGDEILTGEESMDLPPLVCLSACQVAPRGRGTVNITDLLLSRGATAVIGTLIPIDVRRNSMLVMRFFIHLSEAMAGNLPFSTLADVWHYSWMSNAVNDVIGGNASIHEWALSGTPGETVLEEFMLRRSSGRLRKSDVYRDTESVLLEMAKDQGMEDKVSDWLQTTSYIPESLLYAMFGWPETIKLQPDHGDIEQSSETSLLPEVE